MSGHSKWSTIKRKKAKEDAKRGKIFGKLVKEITVAAKLEGGDISANPRLRTAIQTAKEANMPQEHISRAIKKGTGELPGTTYEEVAYEGYGPGGVAILIETMTDNKNRTVSELRHILAKHGGNLGEAGCVNWIFHKKGIIIVKDPNTTEDQLMELVLEYGAEDITCEESSFEIITEPSGLEQIKNILLQAGICIETAEVTLLPQSTVQLDGKTAAAALKLVEKLEEHEDVQNVHANFDIPIEIMEEIANVA